MMADFAIKQASFEDMQFLLLSAKAEGWNPGLHDAAPFFHTDPQGFFIGYLGKEKIGCISAVAYNQSFGFMGFYIVHPSYRKQGFGLDLWKHGLNYLGSRSIGLDGVLAQQSNYEHSQFKLFYKNHRFEGTGHTQTSVNGLVSLSDIPFEVLLAYDLPIFGVPRASFLKAWIEMPNACSLAKMKNGQLCGYGLLRECYQGYKIGPLFADNVDIAAEIFHYLCANAENAPVFLDVPEINLPAMQLAERLHLKPVFATVRMYNKPPPQQQLNKVFGVTTFELG